MYGEKTAKVQCSHTHPFNKSKIRPVYNLSKNAFTLAEIIIVIGIVGIVANMTIPQMVSNVQDAKYKTGKDKVRMSIAEAGRILSATEEIGGASSAEDFVKNSLSKQLKIAKFCAPENMEQCGMPSGNPTTFKNLNNANVASMPTTWTSITSPAGITVNAAEGEEWGTWSTSNPTTSGVFNNSYAFLSADGVAVNLFYNPYCVSTKSEKPFFRNSSETFTTDLRQFSLDTACMAGVYDMNGLSKPNQVGKDIGFFGVFYNGVQSTSAAALPYKEGITTSSYIRGWADNYCRGIKGYKLPTLDELSALYLGKNITGITGTPGLGALWSSSVFAEGAANSYGRFVGFGDGGRGLTQTNNAMQVRCVRD